VVPAALAAQLHHAQWPEVAGFDGLGRAHSGARVGVSERDRKEDREQNIPKVEPEPQATILHAICPTAQASQAGAGALTRKSPRLSRHPVCVTPAPPAPLAGASYRTGR